MHPQQTSLEIDLLAHFRGTSFASLNLTLEIQQLRKQNVTQTFVGFSSTDIESYKLMKEWEKLINFNFKFSSCQMHESLKGNDIIHVKASCRSRIKKGDTYIMLIGNDTRFKHKYLRWEAEVAMEKGCNIICVNLNGMRYFNPRLCPPIVNDIGAIFIPFAPEIIAHAITNYKKPSKGNYKYSHAVYKKLGMEKSVVVV